jgi:DNA-binding Lrp family transcriptional regulator
MTAAAKLDRIDLSILTHLQKDGQLTNVQLAHLVGLSPSPCLQRVKRLEAAGLILGYGARLNLAKLTDSITVFTEVTLNEHRREDLVRFEHALHSVDELMECHLVSGGYDYLLRFVARSVMHYQDVIEALIDRNVGIEKLQLHRAEIPDREDHPAPDRAARGAVASSAITQSWETAQFPWNHAVARICPLGSFAVGNAAPNRIEAINSC